MSVASTSITIRLLLLLLLAVTGGLATAVAQTGGASSGRSIAAIVAPDGSLRSGASDGGSYSARGWRMVLGPAAAPRFVPEDAGATSALLVPIPENANWDDRFGPAGGTDGPIYAVAVDGDEIFIGGDFHHVGNCAAERVARWDGSRWRSLGTGTNNGVERIVLALAVIGDRLYVGGQFGYAGNVQTTNIAAWNRSSGTWSALGHGVSGDEDALVSSFAVKGSDLYVAGRFSAAGNTLANNIAKYDGSRFSRLGGGIYGDIFTLAINGNYLYVGGEFLVAGDAPANRIARWDLTLSTWSAVGSGTDSTVFVIVPDGNDLYIGGHFNVAGGVPAKCIVRWNEVDQSWKQLATGFNLGAPLAVVNAIVVDTASVYVFGNFRMGTSSMYTFNDSVRAGVRYDKRTNTWNRLGQSFIVSSQQIFPQIQAAIKVGREIWIVGSFPNANAMVANNIVKLDIDRLAWTPIGPSVNSAASAIARDGDDFYFGGGFSFAGGHVISRIGRWRDGVWSPLGNGFGSGSVEAITLAGGKIYAGGTIVDSGGIRGVAVWDGSSWSKMGDGLSDTSGVHVRSIVAVGPDIYVAGNFAQADGDTVNSIARWDGTRWWPLGSGLVAKGVSPASGEVNAMAVDGDLLYVGGAFDTAGGIPAANIAVWNMKSGSWSPIPSGANGAVTAMASDGNRIYIGGSFTTIAGADAAGLVAVGHGGEGWTPLAVSHDGAITSIAAGGGILYVGGTFTMIDSVPMANIGRLEQGVWQPLGSGTDAGVRALLADTAGVYGVGSFTEAGELLSTYIGHWTRSVWAGVAAPRGDDAVAGMMLGTIAPNPIGTSAMFTVILPEAASVSLELFAPDGRKVASIVDGSFERGAHTIAWERGGIPDGIYLCRMKSGSRIETRTVILAR